MRLLRGLLVQDPRWEALHLLESMNTNKSTRLWTSLKKGNVYSCSAAHFITIITTNITYTVRLDLMMSAVAWNFLLKPRSWRHDWLPTNELSQHKNARAHPLDRKRSGTARRRFACAPESPHTQRELCTRDDASRRWLISRCEHLQLEDCWAENLDDGGRWCGFRDSVNPFTVDAQATWRTVAKIDYRLARRNK